MNIFAQRKTLTDLESKLCSSERKGGGNGYIKISVTIRIQIHIIYIYQKDRPYSKGGLRNTV